MKISELLNEAPKATIPAVRDLPPIDPIELSNTISQVKSTNEYKDILQHASDITTPAKLKNGSLTFSLKNGTASYVIYSNGQIRIQTSTADRMTRLDSPVPDKDLYTRYVNCLIDLKSKIEKKLKKTQELSDLSLSGDFGEDLSGIEFSPNAKILRIHNSYIKSLKGCPEQLTSLFLYNNKYLESLEGIPKDIDEILSIRRSPKISSFQNLNSLVKRIGEMLIFDHSVKSNILSIFKIKGLNRGIYQADEGQEHYMVGQRPSLLSSIVNKFIKSRDILACQEELMDNGLKEYGKL